MLGFVFGVSKFFLIAAVIAHAAYNIKTVKSSIDTYMSSSILFPILVETGAFIMKLDPVTISKDINATIDEGSQAIAKTVDEVVEQSSLQIENEVKEKIKKQFEENK